MLAPVLGIFSPLLQWVFRGVIVKFVFMAALFAVLSFLVPKAIEYLAPYTGVATLTSAFGGLGSDVWFWLDFFALGYGVPVMISAYITRFLIRRLPVIG